MTALPHINWSDMADEPDGAAQPLLGLDLTALDRPLPEPEWLVPDRIVRRTLTLIGAKPGVGKSWLSEDLAIAVCTARPWLGHHIEIPGRVLYIDAENGDDTALERLQQLGATSASLGGRLHYVTTDTSLADATGAARLAATIAAHRPDLVIIDTLASVAPAAEKDTEASSAFLGAVWHHARSAGAAMVLLHHLRKSLQGAPRDDNLDAFRGAGHLTGATHRAWILEPLAPAEPKFILRDVKARRGRRQDAIRVHVVDVTDAEGRTRTELQVQGTVETVETGYDTYLAAVLTYLGHKATKTATTKELLHLPQAGAERTAKDYLARAKATGVLAQPRHGQWISAQPGLPITNHEDGA